MQKLKALIFDYGNTLIEFSKPQVDHCDRRLEEFLTESFGAVDQDKLKAIRSRDRNAAYQGSPPEYRESDMREISRRLVEELYEDKATDEMIDKLLKVRFDSFVECVEIENESVEVLKRLKKQHHLSLLSNYPDAPAIRKSLEKIAIHDLFDEIVVSADIGLVKPHQELFDHLLSKIPYSRGECLFIGDNWLADVQGAKRAGLQACLFTRWSDNLEFQKNDGDLEADFHCSSLENLEKTLKT